MLPCTQRSKASDSEAVRCGGCDGRRPVPGLDSDWYRASVSQSISRLCACGNWELGAQRGEDFKAFNVKVAPVRERDRRQPAHGAQLGYGAAECAESDRSRAWWQCQQVDFVLDDDHRDIAHGELRYGSDRQRQLGPRATQFTLQVSIEEPDDDVLLRIAKPEAAGEMSLVATDRVGRQDEVEPISQDVFVPLNELRVDWQR